MKYPRTFAAILMVCSLPGCIYAQSYADLRAAILYGVDASVVPRVVISGDTAGVPPGRLFLGGLVGMAAGTFIGGAVGLGIAKEHADGLGAFYLSIIIGAYAGNALFIPWSIQAVANHDTYWPFVRGVAINCAIAAGGVGIAYLLQSDDLLKVVIPLQLIASVVNQTLTR